MALEEGWICGIHLLYAGGASGSPIAFSDYKTYLAYVDGARPGDLFILWSVAEMRRQNLLLVATRDEMPKRHENSLLSKAALERVQQYLSTESHYEVLAAASLGTTSLEAVWTDLGGSEWDKFLDLARRACVEGGELCVLPLTTIDRAELYLLKAKRPNERGEVPSGGAY